MMGYSYFCSETRESATFLDDEQEEHMKWLTEHKDAVLIERKEVDEFVLSVLRPNLVR